MSIVNIVAEKLESRISQWEFHTKPLIVAVSGLQGSGKSYLSENVVREVKAKHPSLNVVNLSLDDFYLTHQEQNGLKDVLQGCPSITTGRGLPGTHSVDVLQSVFSKISNRETHYKIPVYDKSLHKGQGDRAPESEWMAVGDHPLDVVIFEGWFVGFESFSDDELTNHWQHVLSHDCENSHVEQMLSKISFQEIRTINRLLRAYEPFWSLCSYFVHISTDNLLNVYNWRQEQEISLIKAKGTGMTPEEVTAFVDRYYPVYKLYYAKLLQHGLSSKVPRLVVEIGAKRDVLETKELE